MLEYTSSLKNCDSTTNNKLWVGSETCHKKKHSMTTRMKNLYPNHINDILNGLQSPDETTFIKTCQRLRSLMSFSRAEDHSEEFIDFDSVMIDSGVPMLLVRVIQLACIDASMKNKAREAIWALVNIAAGSAQETKAVLGTGAILEISKLIDTFTDHEESSYLDIEEMAVWIMANVSCEPSCKRLLSEINAVEKVFHYYRKSMQLKRENKTFDNDYYGTISGRRVVPSDLVSWCLSNFIISGMDIPLYDVFELFKQIIVTEYLINDNENIYTNNNCSYSTDNNIKIEIVNSICVGLHYLLQKNNKNNNLTFKLLSQDDAFWVNFLQKNIHSTSARLVIGRLHKYGSNN